MSTTTSQYFENIHNPFSINYRHINEEDHNDPETHFFNDSDLVNMDTQYFNTEETKQQIQNLNCTELFSLIHINIRSLNANIDKLKTFLHRLNHQFGIICITESWLTNTDFLKNSNYYLAGYTGVGYERSTGKLGGGICLYIRNDISYKLRNDLSSSSKDNESFFVEIINKKVKIH